MDKGYIQVQKSKYWLDFSVQKTPLGKEIRWSGISKVGKPMWDKASNSEKSHWIYSFKVLSGGFIEFEFDYFDKFIKIVEKDSAEIEIELYICQTNK